MKKHLAPTPLFVAPLLAALLSTSAFAQNSAPMAVPITQTVPDARDVAYPGTMTLDIDASDVVRGAYRVTQTIPVAAGAKELILLYPQWLPGNHGPRGTLSELVGVQFYVDGKPVEWKRDRVEVFAFHVMLPAGAKDVVARFIHTSPITSTEGRITMTPEMLNLQWEKMSLYPAGHYVRQIKVKPTVTLPQGWTAATALDGMSVAGNRATWAVTDYETLVDSPIFAGKNFRKWDLGQNVTLNVVADKPEQLEAKPEHIDAHKALVTEAKLAFGANHFDHYDLLLALSDKIGGIGLEHHRSSENQLEPEAFTEWDKQEWDRNLLPHEYSHSWSGKFRRPARLWTPDYRQPMQGDLLWTYEGRTSSGVLFWAHARACKARTWCWACWRHGPVASPSSLGANGALSRIPASIRSSPRANPSHLPRLPRNEDYYTEGALVWLEIDQILREGTGGKKSIDDFAQSFFGMRPGDWGQIPFEVDEIVTKLNVLYPYDWAKLIDTRINQPASPRR